jgi:hypothetical protein
VLGIALHLESPQRLTEGLFGLVLFCLVTVKPTFAAGLFVLAMGLRFLEG